LETGISNKVILSFSQRLSVLVLCRSTGRSLVKIFVRSPWWWLGGDDEPSETLFNKRLLVLLWCGCCCLLLFSPLFPGHGGVESGGVPVTSCSTGEGRGDQDKFKLIHDRGCFASTIYG
jgi:hypothetical protein